jgi:hypothetical protein
MKKTIAIISAILAAIIPIPANPILKSQPHILSSGFVNQNNLINDNSIDIDDFAFNVNNHFESAEDSQHDKQQMNKYYSPSEKNKSLLSRYLITDIISRITYKIYCEKK